MRRPRFMWRRRLPFAIEVFSGGAQPLDHVAGTLGGICFVLIGGINEFSRGNASWPFQGVIGAAMVTILEFYTGVILNLYGWGWGFGIIPACPAEPVGADMRYV